MFERCLAIVVVALSASVFAAERPDVLVADFESETWGDWTVTGDAFGPGPAKGTLPGQMHVDGYQGERLVNSFHGGDDATGQLTSPPLTIERKFLNVLVGGGKFAAGDRTCIELLIDGQPVRTATGPNEHPGGSERLDWQTWDVAEFAGREATLRIVDNRKGGWGHVCVDQITQSDRRLQPEPASRTIAVAHRYLHLPVKNGAPKRQMRFVVGGKTVREFEIELADGAPDFFAFADVSAFDGEWLKMEIDALPADSKGLERIAASDDVPNADGLYFEPLRPQFHFTSRRGWLNDPNGLVYFDEEWHLFYQHNPYGVEWGNMHWGHAVSDDLVHWKELPIALYPKAFGDWAFSGSAVVDWKNTSGFGDGKKPPLVLAYTSTGRGECIAYSTDRGRTWTEHEGNPVVEHQGRDPKIVWHRDTQKWVMAVYQEKREGDEEAGRYIAFYSSPDLKQWTYESRIEGFYECPDLFELPVQGKEGSSAWVLYAADGEYVLGDFDGKVFKPTSEKQKLWYGNFYAAQTYDNAPDNRQVQIGWGRDVRFPGMPFNQQMVVPVDLALTLISDEMLLLARPVREVAWLRGKVHSWKDLEVANVETTLDGPQGDLYDVEAAIEPGDAETVGLSIRGVPIRYDVKKQELTCHETTAPLSLHRDVIRLRILVDRGSIEVFANGGRVAISVGVIPPRDDHSLKAVATGGTARFTSLTIHEMKSAWDE
ncbi:MAG: GH32 C-terminal domain-containing protein [Planctomycetaceae bacterium]